MSAIQDSQAVDYAADLHANDFLLIHKAMKRDVPGGANAGWWMKGVPLVLQFRQVITRAPKPPVRLTRA